MNRRSILICLACPLIGLILFSGCKSTPKTLFVEDFESYAPGAWKTPGTWTGVKTESWTVMDDATSYIKAGQGQNMIGAGLDTWSDLTLTARVRPGNEFEHGIAVRYNPNYDEYYELCFTKWVEGKGVIILWKIVDGYIHQLGPEIPFSYDFSTFYELKMVLYGANIKCYVNDSRTPLIDYTDDGKSLGNSLRAGKIGLYTEGNAAFDDIKVIM